MTITIEKGIPLPEVRKRQPKGQFGEVMAKMEVGDSFVCEGEKFNTLQSALRLAAKRAGITITTRRENEEAETPVKVRVWRVASPVVDMAGGKS